jgi:chromosome segregation ATPase
MTFSHPAIERLIATVESGLQYGELGPYAHGLRDCLAEIDSAREDVEHFASQCRTANADIRSLTAERDNLESEVSALRRMMADMGREVP